LNFEEIGARGGIGMVERTMPPIELAERLALLLALTLFLGFAFEETYKHDESTIPGGIQTFPLVGLAGLMLYLIEPHWVLAFGAGLFALGARPSNSDNERMMHPTGAKLLDYACLMRHPAIKFQNFGLLTITRTGS
jgi:hypothetical protein